MGIHEGHRARKKKQFLSYGLEPLADHEALELLLYYAIPRADTNPVAHRLIEHFGSLSEVLSARPEELTEVEGVGENAAILLSMILPLYRKAFRTETEGHAILNSAESAGAFFCNLFRGARQETLYEACLDAKSKLLTCCLVAEGGTDSVNLNLRRIVEQALRCNASNVILSHNHPSGVALPSGDDNTTTLMAQDALRAVGIRLVDHIIVADEDFVSLRDNGLLRSR